MVYLNSGVLILGLVGKGLLKNIFLNSRGWNDLGLVDDSTSLDVSHSHVNPHTYSNCSN
jgi:hypothetical protein